LPPLVIIAISPTESKKPAFPNKAQGEEKDMLKTLRLFRNEIVFTTSPPLSPSPIKQEIGGAASEGGRGEPTRELKRGRASIGWVGWEAKHRLKGGEVDKKL